MKWHFISTHKRIFGFASTNENQGRVSKKNMCVYQKSISILPCMYVVRNVVYIGSREKRVGVPFVVIDRDGSIIVTSLA